jgi:hypothetical protein
LKRIATFMSIFSQIKTSTSLFSLTSKPSPRSEFCDVQDLDISLQLPKGLNEKEISERRALKNKAKKKDGLNPEEETRLEELTVRSRQYRRDVEAYEACVQEAILKRKCSKVEIPIYVSLFL